MMSPQTKEVIRRWAIRQAIKVVDYVESQCFLAQSALREQLAPKQLAIEGPSSGEDARFQRLVAGFDSQGPLHKKRRRGLSAAEFDLRYAR